MNAIPKQRFALAAAEGDRATASTSDSTAKQPKHNIWRSWCRLCAQEDADNVDIYEDPNFDNNIFLTTIGKYFWINVKPNDGLPRFFCRSCYDLVSWLVEFTERVYKVQTMYSLLLNNSSTPYPLDALEIRKQYGLVQFEHFVKKQSKEEDYEEANECLEAGEQFEEVPTSFEVQEVETQEQAADETYDIEEEVYEQKHDLNESVEEEGVYEEEELIHVENSTPFEGEVMLIADVKEEEIERGLSSYEGDYEYQGLETEAGTGNESVDGFDAEQNEDSQQSMQMLEEYEEDVDIAAQEEESPLRRCVKVKRRPGEKRAPAEFRFSCPECDRRFKGLGVYRRHMWQRHEIKDETVIEYQCSVCGKMFPTERQLLSHTNVHLPMEEKMVHECPFCHKKFSKDAILKQHIRGVHFNEKPFVCEQCGRAMKTAAALREHKLTHTDDCPFECETCHKCFKNLARLKTHMDTHNTVPYNCEVCGLSLNTRRTLNTHMLVHSDVKRYKCEHCDAEFKRGKALKNHLITHTGLKPYVCNFCNKCFSNGSNCRSHKKKAHPKELAELELTGQRVVQEKLPKLEQLLNAPDKSIFKRAFAKSNRKRTGDWRQRLIAAEERADKLLKIDLDMEIQEGSQGLDDEEGPQRICIVNEDCQEAIIANLQVVNEVEEQMRAMDP